MNFNIWLPDCYHIIPGFWSRSLPVVNKSIKTGFTKMAQLKRHSCCCSGSRKVILSDYVFHWIYTVCTCMQRDFYNCLWKGTLHWKQTLSETHEGPCCVARFPCFPRHYFPLGPRADQVCRQNCKWPVPKLYPKFSAGNIARLKAQYKL